MTTIDPSIAQAPPSVTEYGPGRHDNDLSDTCMCTVTLTGLFILAILFTLYLGPVISAITISPSCSRCSLRRFCAVVNSYTFPSLWARPFC